MLQQCTQLSEEYDCIIFVEGNNDDKTRNKKLLFKNVAPFRSCISKINNTYIDRVELDIAVPMYNLLEYTDNYSMTSESFWNYYRDELSDDDNKNDVNNNRINSDKTITSKYFEYNRKIIGRTPNINNTLDTEVVAPIKYLSFCLRFLNFPLIDCEIELNLPW